MRNDSLTVIGDPSASGEALVAAIRHRGADAGPAGFWNGIADDPAFGGGHRKHCVLQLFKRCFRPEMPLTDFVALFADRAWWRESEWEIIDRLRGKVPVRVGLDRSVYAVNVLPEEDGGLCRVYFSIIPRTDRAEFGIRTRGTGSPPSTDGRRVPEVGYAGDLLAEDRKPW